MAKNKLHIDILGADISISADEKQEYLDMLLEKYRNAIENVRKISSINEPLKLAVLTGFLLCDDLQKAANTTKGTPAAEVERITLGMISQLDEILTAPKKVKTKGAD